MVMRVPQRGRTIPNEAGKAKLREWVESSPARRCTASRASTPRKGHKVPKRPRI